MYDTFYTISKNGQKFKENSKSNTHNINFRN